MKNDKKTGTISTGTKAPGRCLARLSAIGLIVLGTGNAVAQSTEVVCTYAPSQSRAVAAVSGAAGGATATAGAMAAATGLTAVAHSSGALILTGSSGYIAGTLGATATAVAAAPVVVVVGLVVGGAAVTLELVCASRNHPEQVSKVQAAASEFSRRFDSAMQHTKVAAGDMVKSVRPAVDRSALKVRTTAQDVWQYAYRKSGDAKAAFTEARK